VERAEDRCTLWSRAGADLTSCFPDVVTAACAQLSPGTVVDGELVIWKDGRLDFAALAPRLALRGSRHAPPTMAPASFLAFDVLALDGPTCAGSRFGRGGSSWRTWPRRGGPRCS